MLVNKPLCLKRCPYGFDICRAAFLSSALTFHLVHLGRMVVMKMTSTNSNTFGLNEKYGLLFLHLHSACLQPVSCSLEPITRDWCPFASFAHVRPMEAKARRARSRSKIRRPQQSTWTFRSARSPSPAVLASSWATWANGLQKMGMVAVSLCEMWLDEGSFGGHRMS